MKTEREIRLTIEAFETFLKQAKLLKRNEAAYQVWLEPGELVVKVVK